MTPDDLYKAWHAVGADIAGLKFEDFLKHLPAKQEPVAYMVINNGALYAHCETLRGANDVVFNGKLKCDRYKYQHDFKIRPLVFGDTLQPQRQPLDDDKIRSYAHDRFEDNAQESGFFDGVKYAEAAHGIKE